MLADYLNLMFKRKFSLALSPPFNSLSIILLPFFPFFFPSWHHFHNVNFFIPSNSSKTLKLAKVQSAKDNATYTIWKKKKGNVIISMLFCKFLSLHYPIPFDAHEYLCYVHVYMCEIIHLILQYIVCRILEER